MCLCPTEFQIAKQDCRRAVFHRQPTSGVVVFQQLRRDTLSLEIFAKSVAVNNLDAVSLPRELRRKFVGQRHPDFGSRTALTGKIRDEYAARFLAAGRVAMLQRA